MQIYLFYPTNMYLHIYKNSFGAKMLIIHTIKFDIFNTFKKSILVVIWYTNWIITNHANVFENCETLPLCLIYQEWSCVVESRGLIWHLLTLENSIEIIPQNIRTCLHLNIWYTVLHTYVSYAPKWLCVKPTYGYQLTSPS